MNEMLFQYQFQLYPSYLRDGNGMQFFAPFAKHFCKGRGIDVGCGKWPLEGAIPLDLSNGGDAMSLPLGELDYIVSSHCLEHLANPVAALEHWHDRLRPGGVLCLYLPHEDQAYWRPENCRKHLHSWRPERMAEIVASLGFMGVIHSERDLAWSFAVIGWKDEDDSGPSEVPGLQCVYPGCNKLAGGGTGPLGARSNYCREHQPL